MKRGLSPVEDLQRVMRRIDDHLDEAVATLPAADRPLVPNALLNLAALRLGIAEGPARAAVILRRLADFLAAGQQPRDDEAFPLSGHDA